MSKLSPAAAADKWMQEGIKQHEEFLRAFLNAKERALNAGIFFITAKAGFDHGQLEDFLDGYSNKISRRSFFYYVGFAEEVIAWVKAEHPKLIGMEKISVAARAMVLKSPKGFIALCRELKLMRKFGEYDEVKYRKSKLLGDSPQIEFEFSAAMGTLDFLCSEKHHIKWPDGKDEVEAMDEMISKMELALKKWKQIRQHGRTINT